MPTALTPEQTSQIDNARRLLQASTEEILLAALARRLALTLGEGVAAVDLAGAGRSVATRGFRRVSAMATVVPPSSFM